MAAAKTVTLERVHVIRESASSSLSSRTLEKMDMVYECSKLRTAVEHLYSSLAAIGLPATGPRALQSKLCDDQFSCFLVEASLQMVCEHAKHTEWHLLQVD